MHHKDRKAQERCIQAVFLRFLQQRRQKMQQNHNRLRYEALQDIMDSEGRNKHVCKDALEERNPAQ